MSNATDHLALARDYIAKGDDYYGKAAEEIVAARDEGWAFAAIARELDKGETWVRDLVAWATDPRGRATPYGAGAPNNERSDQAKVKKALADPEQRRQVIAALPADVREAVIEESHDAAIADIRAKQAEHDTTPRQPTAGQLMGSDPFDPSESWLDVHIIRVRSKAHALAHQAQKWGVVLGSMTEEEAFEAVQEAERNIAEVRVALQERLRDRDRSEV